MPKLAALAAVLLLLAGPDRPGADRRPRAVVLVTIDTLRADHLGCYGYERPTSPFLDRLAREGTVFENAFASAPHTSPSHASLFTGLHPSQHGVRSNGIGFAPTGFQTLAELFSEAGYDTAAVSAVNFLKPILRGFRSVDLGGDPRRYRSAAATVDAALAYVSKRSASDRFLLWLHLYDPHPPQQAPEECQRALGFGSGEAEESFAREAVERRGVSPGFYRTPAALARNYAQYDSEIRFADRELGRLFERMQAAGLNQGALWIVTADHGEGLGNHAYEGHGKHLYAEHLRVPLIFWEGESSAGQRVRALARHVDLLPTLAEAVGARIATQGFTLQGRSLGPLLRDPALALPHAFAFAQRRPKGPKLRDYEPGEVFSVQDLDWKYIVRTEGRDEFYDLRNDPLELRSLVGAPSAVGERLARLARESFAAAEREGQHAAPRPIDPALEEELRALGYVQ
jgi:arylsulfatase A-like enzyme